MKYKVLKDNKEKPGWSFDNVEHCESCEVTHLSTGDYTVKGFENDFIIERKRTTGEISTNINEPRFEKELERLDGFKNSFIICEFTWDDVYKFPLNSGIPEDVWGDLKVSSSFMLSKLLSYEIKYKSKWILAGDNAKDIAAFLMYKISNVNRQKNTRFYR